MAQLFHRSTHVLARTSLVAIPVALAGAAVLFGALYQSPYFTRVYTPRRQPVPFSHKHHVGGLGIDCRYCHDSVEKSAFSGMPALETGIARDRYVQRVLPVPHSEAPLLSGVPAQGRPEQHPPPPAPREPTRQ